MRIKVWGRVPGECGRERSNCRFHWSPQPKGTPMSLFHKLLIPTAKHCFDFAHMYTAHFHFVWNLPFKFFSWHNLATSGSCEAIFSLKVTSCTFCSLLWMLPGCVDKQNICDKASIKACLQEIQWCNLTASLTDSSSSLAWSMHRLVEAGRWVTGSALRGKASLPYEKNTLWPKCNKNSTLPTTPFCFYRRAHSRLSSMPPRD